MTFAPGNEIISLGDYLPIRVIAGGESQVLAIPSLPPADPGRLITKIAIPLNVRLAFETVARTPTDKPIVCTALAQWPSGRTRLTLGGWGKAPALAMDGSRPDDLVAAARNAFSEAGDEWATKEYRIEIAAVLAKRCLAVTA